MKFDHRVELIGENMAPGAVDANLGISGEELTLKDLLPKQPKLQLVTSTVQL